MAEVSELPYLIRLLDDDDPNVEAVVIERLSEFGGDISHDLAALGITMNSSERRGLADVLRGGRRETLRDEWVVPSLGADAMQDDWEAFENVLRQVSDYFHDGVTLRASLSDSLDLIVDEISADVLYPSAEELRVWLFAEKRFIGAVKKADSESYFDLAYVMANHEGNATSLGVLFMLVGYRMGIAVDGCNYPGHFLNRITVDGVTYLVDPFRRGRKFQAETLLEAHPEISPKARVAVLEANHLGAVLLRYLTEIQATLRALGKVEDEKLFTQLTNTLRV